MMILSHTVVITKIHLISPGRFMDSDVVLYHVINKWKLLPFKQDKEHALTFFRAG